MSRVGDLLARVLVAAVAIPILVFVVYLDNHIFTWALVQIAAVIAMNEFFVMTLDKKSDRIASLIIGTVVTVWIYWAPLKMMAMVPNTPESAMSSGMSVVLLVAVLLCAPIGLWYLKSVDPIETVARRFTASIAGIMYAGVLFMFVGFLKRDFPAGGEIFGGDLIFLLLGVAWAGDTGAYFAGRFLGKKKLYPKVSPGKTWAGAVGGILGSVACGVIIKLTLFPEIPWAVLLIVSIPGAMLGQLGDLAESMLKRSTGVKDSGTLLPGHGGLLDRFDAVLFIAPLLYGSLLLYKFAKYNF